jgi:KaiC/GvpD/RAD55 family RecA-like ATPase
LADAAPYSTGVPFLDEMLGGGLQPGTLTIVYGATGVGKTQLGLSFLHEGLKAEGRRGVIVDMTSRGDSQQHAEYARRLFDWEMREGVVARDDVWTMDGSAPDRFTGLDYAGKPVTRDDLQPEEWLQWRAKLATKLEAATAFLYHHLAAGTRRVMIDSIEPCDRAADSVQIQLVEYIYQQILRTECDWVARNLFRGKWLEVEALVRERRWEKDSVATVLLHTSNETSLTDLVSRRIAAGDLTTNANTIVLLGRQQIGQRLGRAVAVLKHRGQPCSDEIVPFSITEEGLVAL